MLYYIKIYFESELNQLECNWAQNEYNLSGSQAKKYRNR